jgi:hypothetical protein
MIGEDRPLKVESKSAVGALARPSALREQETGCAREWLER